MLRAVAVNGTHFPTYIQHLLTGCNQIWRENIMLQK